MENVVRGGPRLSALPGGGRRPSSLWVTPVVELEGPPPLGRAQPNSRLTLSRTRKAGYRDQQPIFYCGAENMICGVDVSQRSLEVRVENGGAGGSFANHAEGISGLARFCRAQQVDL